MSDLNYRPNISIRDLEVIRALISAGTTVGAAAKLDLSQPAISRSLALLEERLGRALFHRSGGRLIPTEDVLAAEGEIGAIFAALARIEANAAGQPEDARPLRVAVPSTTGHLLLPGVIEAYLSGQPDRRVMVEIYSSDMLVSSVAEGRFDLAISDSTPAHPGVRTTPFRETELVCVMRRDDPLAERDVILARDLHGRQLIAQTLRHAVRSTVARALAVAGVELDVRIEVATVVLAAEMVRRSACVALVNPFPAVHGFAPELCLRPFRPSIVLTTSFLTPAVTPISTDAQEFMALVRHAATFPIIGPQRDDASAAPPANP